MGFTSIQTATTKIFLPPRKKKKGRSKSITLRFVISGIIPSKKNNQIPVTRRQEAYEVMRQAFLKGHATMSDCVKMIKAVKARIRPNTKFDRWHQLTLEDIKVQRDRWTQKILKCGLNFPLSNCSMNIYHYFTSTRRLDLTNKALSIEDLFVDAHILVDDDWQHSAPVSGDGDLYKGEMRRQVTIVSLTAYY